MIKGWLRGGSGVAQGVAKYTLVKNRVGCYFEIKFHPTSAVEFSRIYVLGTFALISSNIENLIHIRISNFEC